MSAARLTGDGGSADQAAVARPKLGTSRAARAAGATLGEWRTAVDFGREEEANAVAVQPDGKVVVAGTSRSPDHSRSLIVVTRHLPDGALDPSFGAGGRVTEDLGPESDAQAVLALPDGRIVVAGAAGDSVGDPGMAMLQYLPDGSRNRSFGEGDGLAKISSVAVSPGFTFNECLRANAIVRQGDDRLVVVGSVSCGGEAGGPSVAVARRTQDLVPDEVTTHSLARRNGRCLRRPRPPRSASTRAQPRARATSAACSR